MKSSQTVAAAIAVAAMLITSAADAGPFWRMRVMRHARLYGTGVHVSAPGVNVNVGAPYAPPMVPMRAPMLYGPLMQTTPQAAPVAVQQAYPLAHQPGCIGGNCPQQVATGGAMCPSQGGTCRVGRNVYVARIDPRAQARCAREAQIMAQRQKNWTRRDGGHPLGIDPSTGARVGGTGAGMRPDTEVCEPNGSPRRWIVIGDASVRGRDGRWYRSVAYRPMRS